MNYDNIVSFDILKGATIHRILVGVVGNYRSVDALYFDTSVGMFQMYHHQDCCENVDIEDVIGDIADIIGSIVLLAEEVSNADEPAPNDDRADETWEWTFYKLSTVKGDVTIRWFGTSNGYYSTGVSVERIDAIPEGLSEWKP